MMKLLRHYQGNLTSASRHVTRIKLEFLILQIHLLRYVLNNKSCVETKVQHCDIWFKWIDISSYLLQTPDFSEDVGIVLDALHTKYDLPLSNSQESIPTLPEKRPAETTEKADVLNKPCNESVETEEERLESWPQPPTSLELECSDVVQEPNNRLVRACSSSCCCHRDSL